MPIPQNNFLTDYSGAAAAGSAFQGFADAFATAQDRALKRQELQARMLSMQAEQQHAADELALTQRIHGLQQGPDGGLQEAPMSQRELLAQKIGAAEKGVDVDDQGNISYDKNSPQMMEARARIAAAKAISDRFGENETDKTNKDWESFAGKINDPSSRATLGRYQQNIDNANRIKVLESQLGMPEGQSAPPNETQAQRIARYNQATPNQLYEIAKANDNLISGGNSTVFGTEHMLPKTMGQFTANAEGWAENKQLPANAGQIIDTYMGTVNREAGYMLNRRDNAVNGLAAGYSHLKAKDPQRWNTVLGTLTSGAQPNPQEGYGETSGLVKPAGLVSKGLVSSQPSVGTNPPPAQDPDIAKWAKANNLDYATGARIIAKRRAAQGAQAQTQPAEQ